MPGPARRRRDQLPDPHAAQHSVGARADYRRHRCGVPARRPATPARDLGLVADLRCDLIRGTDHLRDLADMVRLHARLQRPGWPAPGHGSQDAACRRADPGAGPCRPSPPGLTATLTRPANERPQELLNSTVRKLSAVVTSQ